MEKFTKEFYGNSIEKGDDAVTRWTKSEFLQGIENELVLKLCAECFDELTERFLKEDDEIPLSTYPDFSVVAYPCARRVCSYLFKRVIPKVTSKDIVNAIFGYRDELYKIYEAINNIEFCKDLDREAHAVCMFCEVIDNKFNKLFD